MSIVLQRKATGGKDSWCTPDHVIDAIRAIDAIALDVATNSNNPTGAKRCYTPTDDGLLNDWANDGLNFCNPPFSRAKVFVEKASRETLLRDAEIVMLLAARVGANWWQPVWNARAICFVRGRLKFKDPESGEAENGATFDTALVYWGHRSAKFGASVGHLGHVMDLRGSIGGLNGSAVIHQRKRRRVQNQSSS